MKVSITALLLGLTVTASAFAESPTIDPAKDRSLNINTSKIFHSTYVERHADKFEFNDQGDLIDGPRAARGEPIDYGRITSPGVLLYGFHQLAGCSIITGVCKKPIGKLSSKTVRMQGFKAGYFKWLALYMMAYNMNSTLEDLGFKLIMEKDRKKADMSWNFGTVQYLAWQAKRLGDDAAHQAMVDWLLEYDRVYQNAPNRSPSSFDGFVREPFCFTSFVDQDGEKFPNVYVNKAGSRSCLAKALLTAIGVGETSVGIASVTDQNGKYSKVTSTDEFLIGLLYDPTFPDTYDHEDLTEFFRRQIFTIIDKRKQDKSK